MRKHFNSMAIWMISALLTNFSVAPASGQIPDKFSNLQALPKDINKRALVDTMKSFTRSLGVRCQYCHIGEEGRPLSTFDFVSDAKATKQTARLMLQMVHAINNVHLAKLGKPAANAVQVGCVTCHHGQNRPRALEAVLFEVIAENGAAAGVEKYHELRKKYYGGFTFDFRDGVLNNLAQQLQAAGKGDDAITMLKLNAEVYPEAPMTYFLLGELYLMKGEKTLAMENYKKTLSLAPDNPIAKKKLDELAKQ
jgi:hypothetical protein